MEALMDTIRQFCDVIGMPEGLIGAAIAIAILIRFARARLVWFTWSVAMAAALVLACGLAWSMRAQIENVYTAALAATATVLILQGLLQSLVGVPGFGWIPADNAWAPIKPDAPSAPTTTPGGTP